MQPEPTPMRREPLYTRRPQPRRAQPRLPAGGWPFPDVVRRLSPEIRHAALQVLRTTAREWGLAVASR